MGWGGGDWATLAGVGYGAYQAGGGRAAMGAALPMIGSAFGPWGTLAGVVLGGLFGGRQRPEPVIEPIPVKVVNWQDMASALLNISKGEMVAGASLALDRIAGNLRVREMKVGLEW